MGALLYYVLRFTGGHLIYTLDDPYIHLSLAENLLRGHYGVNLNEVASPSSSIIYPFLLAATLALGFGDTAPLVLNIVGALGGAWLLAGFLWDALHKSEDGKGSWVAYVTVPFLLLAVNGYALAFTGMEHTLHVFASLAIVAGLTRVSRDVPPRLALLVAIVAAPLLRFEGFALSGAALLALAYWGHWSRALLTGGVIAVVVGAYVALMASLGLPLLPSSVMVKSGTAQAVASSHYGAIFFEIFLSLKESLTDRQGVVLAIGVVLMLLGAAWNKDRPQARVVACVVAAAAIGHLLVGRWNWFSRYEIYIIASAISALLVVWAPQLSMASRRITTPGLMIFVSPLIGFTYAYVILLTPFAAQNIYEQQYQMHRFAVDYFPEPVAVTDLGWVTYRNDNYVLDLWGLGNETARQLFNAEGRNPGPIQEMARNADVTFAMLYEEIFYEGLPDTWCQIAQLETIQKTASYATVEFYLIKPEQEAAMREAMDAFTPTLPGTATLTQYPCTAN